MPAFSSHDARVHRRSLLRLVGARLLSACLPLSPRSSLSLVLFAEGLLSAPSSCWGLPSSTASSPLFFLRLFLSRVLKLPAVTGFFVARSSSVAALLVLKACVCFASRVLACYTRPPMLDRCCFFLFCLQCSLWLADGVSLFKSLK